MAELERIETESRHQVRHERWRTLPTRGRDRAILIDHDQRGVDVLTLAHQHRISTTRVREILRTERYRQEAERMSGPPASSGPGRSPRRQWIDLPAGFPQTDAVPTDP